MWMKVIVGLKKLLYDQSLKLLNLPSLELRRLHTHRMWCYKIVFGIVDLACDEFFPSFVPHLSHVAMCAICINPAVHDEPFLCV